MYQVFSRCIHEEIQDPLGRHPAYQYYKAASIFDPRHLPIISIGDYKNVKVLCNPSPLKNYKLFITHETKPFTTTGRWRTEVAVRHRICCRGEL